MKRSMDEEKKDHSLLETHELQDSALDQKYKDGNSIERGRSENNVRIPDEWAHPDQKPSRELGMGGKDGNEGVQESGAGTGDHSEFMPPELIQGNNTAIVWLLIVRNIV
jgi:hypothetical protein